MEKLKRSFTTEVHWRRGNAGLLANLHIIEGSKYNQNCAALELVCYMKAFGEGTFWLDVPKEELPEGTRLKITVERLEGLTKRGKKKALAAAAGK
jgi:hypothetical protein